MTRDEIVDAWLVSPHHADAFGRRSFAGPHSPREHVRHIRAYKPIALSQAYRIADFVLALNQAIEIERLREALEEAAQEFDGIYQDGFDSAVSRSVLQKHALQAAAAARIISRGPSDSGSDPQGGDPSGAPGEASQSGGAAASPTP